MNLNNVLKKMANKDTPELERWQMLAEFLRQDALANGVDLEFDAEAESKAKYEDGYDAEYEPPIEFPKQPKVKGVGFFRRLFGGNR